LALSVGVGLALFTLTLYWVWLLICRFETVKPSGGKDRVCEAVTVCSTSQIQKTAPTLIADRVCISIPKSCKDLVGIEKKNGVYKIQPANQISMIPAYCNMERDGGGWTLLLISSDDGNSGVFRGNQLPQVRPSVSTPFTSVGCSRIAPDH
jgi:hypothetical protein